MKLNPNQLSGNSILFLGPIYALIIFNVFLAPSSKSAGP